MDFKKQLVPILVLGVLFCYVAYRSANLSFTHDEALSYQIIKGDEGLAATANHHQLNSWLMQVCSYFSEAEWCLRLPNTLSFLLFSFYFLKAIKPLALTLQLCLVLPIVFLNNYLLDFFSLARGYGLSLGLMLPALYYLLMDGEETFRKQVLALGFAFAATLANLNLVNFFIASACVAVLKQLSNKQFTLKDRGLKCLQILSILAIGTVIAGKRLLFLKAGGQLYFGNESLLEGFDSIVLWSLDLSKLPGSAFLIIRSILAITWLATAVIVLKQFPRFSVLTGLWLLSTLICGGMLAEHYLFDALYPQNRTALFVIPILVLLLAYFLQELVGKMKALWAELAVTVLLTLVVVMPMLLQFKQRSNGAGVSEWMYDASTKQVAEYVSNHVQPASKVLACNWLFKPALQYYLQSRAYRYELLQLDQPDAMQAPFIYDFYNDELRLTLGRKTVITFNNNETALFVK